MLETTIKNQLSPLFNQLAQPVTLTLYLDDSPAASELERLATEVASLSPMLAVTTGYPSDSTRLPGLAIGSGSTSRIYFAGVPSGHEFTSLVMAILHSGGHPAKIADNIRQAILAIDTTLDFEVYVSMSCQNCPVVVQALNTLAALNPNVNCTLIDGALFPNEVSERQVMSVPSIFLNGKPFAQGRLGLEAILDKLSPSQPEDLPARRPLYDVLVIGGGPAGASAAIYAARKGLVTGMVAERFGGQVLDTVTIENFIATSRTEGAKLAASLEAHVRDYDIDILEGQLVSGLEPGTPATVTLASGGTLKARSVILATGARWREMRVPGEAEYRGKGVAYCPHCDGPLFKGKPVAVIGGGNSGIEAAIDLAGITESVTVLEFADQLRADEVLLKQAAARPNIRIHTQAATTEVLGDGQRVTGLKYRDRRNDELHQLDVAGIFVQIGLVPNTGWLAESGIPLNERGEIVTGKQGETGLPGIFAAGDCTDSPYKQIIIAMGDGATAALGAFDYLVRSGIMVEKAA